MDYITVSHRNAEIIFCNDPEYNGLWREVKLVLDSITDEDIITEFSRITRHGQKSLSQAINTLIKDRFISFNWNSESPIFNDPNYNETRWRLDFAKDLISVEVAFNHGEAISWNLLKPVLASELNHVKKAIQTSAGIIICATEEMKEAGNFDGAVGTFEKFQRYLIPMYNILPSPLLLIGLKAPKTFHVDHITRQIIRH